MNMTHHTLATRFGRNVRTLRSETPLSDEQMRAVAPSVFATGKHESRSGRYTYIPTIDVLHGLKREGFEPFMVAQGHSRIESKADYTKHLIRLRHAGRQASQSKPATETHEVILINSHDGASSYQMMSGLFRFICCNGLVVGDVAHDIRVPHRGDVQGEVIEGAFKVLDSFEDIGESVDAMKSITLRSYEEQAFATAALALRFGERAVEQGGHVKAPITAQQLSEPRRPEDTGRSLWNSYQRVQENVKRGGQDGRTAQMRRMTTRPVTSIDRSVSLNRALWVLAEEMRRLKG